VTDIDATVLVKATGTLGLFQLKWQDPFGGDLRERRSRMTNLVPSANGWVQDVSEWLLSNGPEAVLKLAKFQGDVPDVRRVILFVVGRYHCSFSRAERDPRCVWCTWPQLIRAINEIGIVPDPIAALEESLKKGPHQEEPRTKNRMGTLQMRDFVIETNCGPKGLDG
jgi:hypothetical protein